MRANLDRATKIELAYEGGYVNHPKDPGGPTNLGITIAALSAHRGRPCTAADVVALTPDEAIDIYEEVYAPAIRFDDLPAGVDLLAYDCAINQGRDRAARFLQIAAHAVPVDGQVGPGTLAAVRATPAADLFERLRAEREAHYRSLAAFKTFGKGWLRRLTAVAGIAAAWAPQT